MKKLIGWVAVLGVSVAGLITTSALIAAQVATGPIMTIAACVALAGTATGIIGTVVAYEKRYKKFMDEVVKPAMVDYNCSVADYEFEQAKNNSKQNDLSGENLYKSEEKAPPKDEVDFLTDDEYEFFYGKNGYFTPNYKPDEEANNSPKIEEEKER